MRIGLFGGSFNPVHLGHVLVAHAAREELQLNRVFLIPAARSPFKSENQPAPDEHRAAMLRLAFAGETFAELDEQEIQRGGTSFTIDTVRAYARRFPGTELFYLIGADNVAALPQWRDAEELARLAQFAAIPRPGQAAFTFTPPFRGRTLQGFPFGVSSSEIRARIKANLPIHQLVPPAVAEYILKQGLYR